jgi:Zn-dependent protease with chaperone function
MSTSITEFYYRRFRNQIAHAIAAGACLLLGAAGIFFGAVLGVKLMSFLPELPSIFQAFFVITTTAVGFIAGSSAAYGLGPIWIRAGFSAKSYRRRIQLPETIGGKIDVFLINDEKYTSFGKNVVIAGFKGGKGLFRPAIFISSTVAAECTSHEIDSIIAHELGHLASSHLKKRVLSSIGLFSCGAVFTALLLLGMHWSGYATLATHFGTFAGIIPAVLTWIHNRRLVCEHEKEADLRAVHEFGATPAALISALKRLSQMNSGFSNSLFQERIKILESMTSSTAPVPTPEEPSFPVAA